jgi:hypothetical protein
VGREGGRGGGGRGGGGGGRRGGRGREEKQRPGVTMLGPLGGQSQRTYTQVAASHARFPCTHPTGAQCPPQWPLFTDAHLGTPRTGFLKEEGKRERRKRASWMFHLVFPAMERHCSFASIGLLSANYCVGFLCR